jgi:hypothetical protein
MARLALVASGLCGNAMDEGMLVDEIVWGGMTVL